MNTEEKVDFLEGRIHVLSVIIHTLTAADRAELTSSTRKTLSCELHELPEQKSAREKGIHYQCNKFMQP